MTLLIVLILVVAVVLAAGYVVVLMPWLDEDERDWMDDKEDE